MKAPLHICPGSLQDGHETYSSKASRALFDGHVVSPWLDFSLKDELQLAFLQQNIHSLSISGVQEKFAAVIDKGHIRLAKAGEQSTYILKPAPLSRVLSRKQIPMNEHLTMQIAHQVYGITTAQNGLCFDRDGQPVYITRRFDVLPDGSKQAQEDFCSLIGRTETTDGGGYKYMGAYEDIANVIRQFIPAWMPAMERFFQLLVFNYIFANGDAHLKNFSILYKDKEPMLAPAYDLINSYIHVHDDDFCLSDGLSRSLPKSDSYLRTGHPCQDDFRRFGLQIGLLPKRIDRIFQPFLIFPKSVSTLIRNSYLSDDRTKRNYFRIVKERRLRFIRELSCGKI